LSSIGIQPTRHQKEKASAPANEPRQSGKRASERNFVSTISSHRGWQQAWKRRALKVARFTTAQLPPPLPKPGVHAARIVKATEKTSEAGNTVLRMTARFVDLSELSFAVTFVERAAKLIGFFCRSCELELPEGAGVEVEIRPEDVAGRIFYPLFEMDGDGIDAVPRITKFLSRSEAVTANPAIAQLKLQPQSPRVLRAVNGGSL
jgi:hypothetical protein